MERPRARERPLGHRRVLRAAGDQQHARVRRKKKQATGNRELVTGNEQRNGAVSRLRSLILCFRLLVLCSRWPVFFVPIHARPNPPIPRSAIARSVCTSCEGSNG